MSNHWEKYEPFLKNQQKKSKETKDKLEVKLQQEVNKRKLAKNKIISILEDIKNNHPGIKSSNFSAIILAKDSVKLCWGNKFSLTHDEAIFIENNLFEEDGSFLSIFFDFLKPKIPYQYEGRIIENDFHFVRINISNNRILGFSIDEFLQNSDLILPKLVVEISNPKYTFKQLNQGGDYWQWGGGGMEG